MLNRAHVKRADGSVRSVKNLGWLLRNWKAVDRFLITADPTGHDDALLKVNLRDGVEYAIGFASFSVLLGFLDRPVFRGRVVFAQLPKLNVDFIGEVGSKSYRAIKVR